MKKRKPSGDRPRYKARRVTLLECRPSNLGHAGGIPVVTMMMANNDGDIEPLIISLADARTLAARLLICLYTEEDKFAEEVLEAKFPCDEDGRFHWPRSEE